MTRVARLVLTVDEIRDITHYAHWIPIVRGYHHEFIEKRYPGWSWNQLLPVMFRAKILRPHKEGHECVRLRMGICIISKVRNVEIAQYASGAKVTAVTYEFE